MSSRQADVRPEVGDILVVIHDFQARSSDELTLAKGDRVELIERDDEFGDGWFLGRHMVNGNNGLFPEVYTRAAPKGGTATSLAPKPASNSFQAPPSNNTSLSELAQPSTTKPVMVTPTTLVSTPAPTPVAHQLHHSSSTNISPASAHSPAGLPSSSMKQENRSASAPTAPLANKPSGYSTRHEMGHVNQSSSQDSQVLHDTLTVINEHITDLHSSPQNGHMRHTADSGSEYSSHLHDRLSYIQGEETDEEEDAPHSRADVEAWTADDVAEYLFTIGVEKQHCEVFRDQEIAGEVLLGMDQSSLFLKAFDLGSVGRRLKTWQKIKALQDEVNGQGFAARRQTAYGSDGGSEESRAPSRRSRTSTLTNAQRLSPIEDRPASIHGKRLSQNTRIDSISSIGPNSPKGSSDNSTKPSHQKRPSAASVRDLHQSRRHSTTDFLPTANSPGPMTGTPKLFNPVPYPQPETSHKKQPSFDRNWTMGAAPTQHQPRPLSSAGFHEILNASDPDLAQESTVDPDRGYFSGTELDGRRSTKKRGSIVSSTPQSSYADQQRVRSATALSRHSRFGSVGSARDVTQPQSAQMYQGNGGDHRRTTSVNSINSYRPPPPAKDCPPPTVTKLEHDEPDSSQGTSGDWLSNTTGRVAGFSGLRAISDAVIGSDRSKLGSPTDPSTRESPLQSPARPGSSTPSGGPSFDLELPDAGRSPYSTTTTGSRKSGKKTKKETSAYLRGLQKISPRDAIKDADYSGWMKKKNSHLMTTWKPRLFVLKGRRLSYYYSEDDTDEKGLIDISFHRVLPADNERLTGLHATLTGASNTPMTPTDRSLQTLAESGASAEAAIEKGADSMFIFKLMPPRAGLSKAVNFTKPTVHYFAVPNIQQGRAWMAALMKATIDRDESQPMTSTYQQKTISLAKARQMHHRPPALMNLDEKIEEGMHNDERKGGLGISFGEVDSAVSGLDKPGAQKALRSASGMLPSIFSSNSGNATATAPPPSA
ncbi:hypothetical protein GGS21DRAFT_334224 [Xylaria nigripes]|nr:hypothetical protein GGS21DRAFT_334224 [Xylaria nigripes]